MVDGVARARIRVTAALLREQSADAEPARLREVVVQVMDLHVEDELVAGDGSSRRVEVTGGVWVQEIAAADRADGELVLLLHGFPQTSFCYRYQLPALAAAGYRVVAPDQRGYSRRARPAEVGEYRADRLVGDVLGFADALGAATFHLVGH